MMITKVSQRRKTRNTSGDVPSKSKMLAKEVEQRTPGGLVPWKKGEKGWKKKEDHSIIKEAEYSNRGRISKEHTTRY